MILKPNKWPGSGIHRWMMSYKSPLSDVIHTSSITLKDIRLAKIKTTVKHGLATKEVKTRPLMTWVINHAINKAVDDTMKSVEISTNMNFDKGKN